MRESGVVCCLLFFSSIRRLHMANWLSAAKTRAAKVVLGLRGDPSPDYA